MVLRKKQRERKGEERKINRERRERMAQKELALYVAEQLAPLS